MKQGTSVIVIHPESGSSFYGTVHETGDRFFSVSVFGGKRTLIFDGHSKLQGTWMRGDTEGFFCATVP